MQTLKQINLHKCILNSKRKKLTPKYEAFIQDLQGAFKLWIFWDEKNAGHLMVMRTIN